MTLSQLRALLKQNLHSDTTFSDPDDLHTFLTLGQKRIVHDAPAVLGSKQAEITTVDDTRDYSLESDFYQMVGAWNTDQSIKLEPVSRRTWVEAVEARSTIPKGIPRQYRITGYDTTESAWRVRLYYTPDSEYTIKYFYYWMPLDINNTNGVGPIAEIGFEELLLWAATMLARERNDPDGHAVAFSNYRRLLSEYKAYSTDKPDRIYALKDRVPPKGGSTLRLPPEFPF